MDYTKVKLITLFFLQMMLTVSAFTKGKLNLYFHWFVYEQSSCVLENIIFLLYVLLLIQRKLMTLSHVTSLSDSFLYRITILSFAKLSVNRLDNFNFFPLASKAILETQETFHGYWEGASERTKQTKRTKEENWKVSSFDSHSKA